MLMNDRDGNFVFYYCSFNSRKRTLRSCSLTIMAPMSGYVPDSVAAIRPLYHLDEECE